jgi:succinyl-CoA synthetase alpha subunit
VSVLAEILTTLNSFKDHLFSYEEDDETEMVVLIGENSGHYEVAVAAFTRDCVSKPVISYIVGLTAPKRRRMVHDGAIITTNRETVAEIMQIMEDCGVTLVK